MGKMVFVVAYHYDGTVCGPLLKYAVQLFTGCFVQMGLRLIEQQQVGFRHHGTCQQCALPLATAQLGDRSFGQVFQVKHAEHVLYLGLVCRGKPLPQPFSASQSREYDVCHRSRKLSVYVAVLRQIAYHHPLASFYLSAGRLEQSGYQAQQSGLSTSIGAGQCDEIIPFDDFLDVAEHVPFAVAQTHIVYVKNIVVQVFHQFLFVLTSDRAMSRSCAATS